MAKSGIVTPQSVRPQSSLRQPREAPQPARTVAVRASKDPQGPVVQRAISTNDPEYLQRSQRIQQPRDQYENV